MKPSAPSVSRPLSGSPDGSPRSQGHLTAPPTLVSVTMNGGAFEKGTGTWSVGNCFACWRTGSAVGSCDPVCCAGLGRFSRPCRSMTHFPWKQLFRSRTTIAWCLTPTLQRTCWRRCLATSSSSRNSSTPTPGRDTDAARDGCQRGGWVRSRVALATGTTKAEAGGITRTVSSRQGRRPASEPGSPLGKPRHTPGSATARHRFTPSTGPRHSPSERMVTTAHGPGPIPSAKEDWMAIGVPWPPG